MSRSPRRVSPDWGPARITFSRLPKNWLRPLLVLAAEPFRHTHDLDDLAARLRPVYPQFAAQNEAVRHLSVWGIAYRYPGLEDAPEPLPEIEELEQMINMLKEFAAMAGSLIEQE
jgi:hypothetical protein